MNGQRGGHRLVVLLAVSVAVLLAQADASGCIFGCNSVRGLAGLAKVIVKARILETEAEEDLWCGTLLRFTAEVLETLKSDGEAVPKTVSLTDIGHVWPTRLGVLFEEQQAVLLLLDRGPDGVLLLHNDISAVLPACERLVPVPADTDVIPRIYAELKCVLEDYGPYTTPEEARKEMESHFEEVHAEGFHSQNPKHHVLWPWRQKNAASKAELLLEASYLAPVSELSFFAEYSKAPEPEMQDATLAATLYIAPTPAAVEALARQLTSAPDSEVWKKAHGYVFKVLDAVSKSLPADKMKSVNIQRAQYCLPLYRAYADHAPMDDASHLMLMRVFDAIGENEDLPRMYRLCDAGSASLRREALQRLARKVGIAARRPQTQPFNFEEAQPDTVIWESETRKAIEAVLAQKGTSAHTAE